MKMPTALKSLIDQTRQACVREAADALVEDKGWDEAVWDARTTAKFSAAVLKELLGRTEQKA